MKLSLAKYLENSGGEKISGKCSLNAACLSTTLNALMRSICSNILSSSSPSRHWWGWRNKNRWRWGYNIFQSISYSIAIYQLSHVTKARGKYKKQGQFQSSVISQNLCSFLFLSLLNLRQIFNEKQTANVVH